MAQTIKIFMFAVVLAAPPGFANHLNRFGDTGCAKYWQKTGHEKYGHCFTVIKPIDNAVKSSVKNECGVDLKAHVGVEYADKVHPSRLHGFGWSVETVIPAGEEVILHTPGDFAVNVVEWFFCEID